MKNKIVFLQGTFDVINWGHVKAFQLAKSFGDYLIIGVNSDALVKTFKGFKPVLPWYQRSEIIKNFKQVDEVIECKEFSPISHLRDRKVNVYCITEEWQATKKVEYKFMESQPKGEIKILPRFKGVISSFEMKKALFEQGSFEDRLSEIPSKFYGETHYIMET